MLLVRHTPPASSTNLGACAWAGEFDFLSNYHDHSTPDDEFPCALLLYSSYKCFSEIVCGVNKAAEEHKMVAQHGGLDVLRAKVSLCSSLADGFARGHRSSSSFLNIDFYQLFVMTYDKGWLHLVKPRAGKERISSGSYGWDTRGGGICWLRCGAADHWTSVQDLCFRLCLSFDLWTRVTAKSPRRQSTW